MAVEGSPLGVGDCWGAFRLIDRIALTMHGEDRSNQQHTEPREVYKNAQVNNTGPTLPGEPITISNTNPDGPPADYALVEPTGAAREYSYRSIDKWEELLYKAVGLSRLDPATLTNKGNMTRLALMTAYARTVATSDLKRVNYGEAGLSVFFRTLLVGISRTGAFGELGDVDEMIEVPCQWQDYFSPTDADLTDLTNRTVTQVKNNLLPAPRAATRLATAEGIPPAEHDDLLAELEDEEEKRQSAANNVPVSDDVPGASTASGSEALSELGDTSGGLKFQRVGDSFYVRHCHRADGRDRNCRAHRAL